MEYARSIPWAMAPVYTGVGTSEQVPSVASPVSFIIYVRLPVGTMARVSHIEDPVSREQRPDELAAGRARRTATGRAVRRTE